MNPVVIADCGELKDALLLKPSPTAQTRLRSVIVGKKRGRDDDSADAMDVAMDQGPQAPAAKRLKRSDGTALPVGDVMGHLDSKVELKQMFHDMKVRHEKRLRKKGMKGKKKGKTVRLHRGKK